MNLDALLSLLAKATPEQQAEIDRFLAPEAKAVWQPDPRNKPQMQAYLSEADIMLFGGQAGGGKSDLLVGLALTLHRKSVIFRREAKDLQNIEERLTQLAGRDGWNSTLKILRRKDLVIELSHLEAPGSEQSWQGRDHDLYGFDEGAQLSREKVQFVIGWNRSVIPDQRCRVVIASNPPMSGEGEWLIEWFAPWIDPAYPKPAKDGELRWAVTAFDRDASTLWVESGAPLFFTTDIDYRLATPEEIEARHERVKTPLTRTFIRSRLDNNPYLAGTDYRSRLQNMRQEVRRALLEGDFMASRKDHEWQVIPTEWVKLAQRRWKEHPPRGAVMEAIGVDVAQGGADDTVLAPRYRTPDDSLVWYAPLIEVPGVETPNPSDVSARVIRERRNGAAIIIDVGGGYGGGPMERLTDNKIEVTGFNGAKKTEAKTRDGSLGFYNLRAWAWWRFGEALNPDNGPEAPLIAIPDDPRILAELTAVRYKMRGTDILVESKEDLKKADRLGRSPDRADAIVMAWAMGQRVLALRGKQAAQASRRYRSPNSPYAPGEIPPGTGWLGV